MIIIALPLSHIFGDCSGLCRSDERKKTKIICEEKLSFRYGGG